MGIILSRVRKRKSPVETLEKLDHDIKEIEESRTYAQMRYRKITKLFLVYSVGLYVLFGVFLYFHFTSSVKGKLLYLVPFALSPLLLYLIKRVIAWYYVRLIDKNQKRLTEMKKEKKRILDEVMDKETYKVAKEILDKFSSETQSKASLNMQVARVNEPNEGLRKRITTVSNMPKTQPPINMARSFVGSPPPRPISHSPMPNRGLQAGPMVRLPAPILPLQRSYVDRVVEYLIGDGPNNRYALICSRCSSHNGMALKEEFEYLNFKCCYCFHFNPARKIRPEAPRLEGPLQANQESDSDSDSKTSEGNSEGETKAILTIEELDVNSDYAKASSPDELTLKPNDGTEEPEKGKDPDKISDKEIEEDEIIQEPVQEEVLDQPEGDVSCDTLQQES